METTQMPVSRGMDNVYTQVVYTHTHTHTHTHTRLLAIGKE